jgi:hypothetical protein
MVSCAPVQRVVDEGSLVRLEGNLERVCNLCKTFAMDARFNCKGFAKVYSPETFAIKVSTSQNNLENCKEQRFSPKKLLIGTGLMLTGPGM